MDENTTCTRRDMFKTLLAEFCSAADGLASQYAAPMTAAFGASAGSSAPAKPFVRPPGAVAEDKFLELCTRCDDCVKACPEWVIRKAGPELGERLSGTPLLMPAQNPCIFCEGLPCITACKTGALVQPKPGERVRIGRAVVSEAACYMSQGQPCDYCIKPCPTQPKAISLGARGKPARVDAALCTGCGECAQICPANAISIEASR